ncbi:MAG: proline dehydrogenase [Polyangiaceae bacterium]|nr:proline dehydrogenase [Polyangiaceae bacterium]
MSRPETRVRQLLIAAKKLVDPKHPLGARLRSELPGLTGLSPEGVAYALEHNLEVNASSSEVLELCQSVPQVERAHVLLSANVFVAGLRAVALGLAASPKVFVRSSRREPLVVRLLEEASKGAFRVVDELVPLPGDHLWAYGSDETLTSLRGELPAGVVLHPHGSGFGVAVYEADAARLSPQAAAEALARDVGVFDQRGCLSPRILIVQGDVKLASELARRLARELSAFEARIPRGELSPAEAADVTLYRDSMAYAGELHFAGKGCVGLDTQGDRLMLAPVGRHMHVVHTHDAPALVAGLGPDVAALGVDVSPALQERLVQALPKARLSTLGQMQRPRFDGPVDKRPLRDGVPL